MEKKPPVVTVAKRGEESGTALRERSVSGPTVGAVEDYGQEVVWIPGIPTGW